MHQQAHNKALQIVLALHTYIGTKKAARFRAHYLKRYMIQAGLTLMTKSEFTVMFAMVLIFVPAVLAFYLAKRTSRNVGLWTVSA